MDDGPRLFSLFGILILVVLSAFFSASETAFSSLNRIRLKNLAAGGNKKALRAQKLSENYDKTISTLLVGNNIVNIAAASLGTLFFTGLLKSSDTGALVSTIVITIVVLIFGEVVPKSIAKDYAESFAMAVSWMVDLLSKIFTPITIVLTGIRNLFSRRIKRDESQELPTVTEEELKVIIEEIEDEGVLDTGETELLQSALEFSDTTVEEILTPRVDVTAVAVDDSPTEVLRIFMEERYSRLPVYDGSVDSILGILNMQDFFTAFMENGGDIKLSDLVQKALFVPGKMRINELLRELQVEKLHMAIVTDQYGGTKGIVTMEDIIEELVGDIWDEHDEIEHEMIRLSDGKYKVDGSLNIIDFFEELGIPCTKDDFDSTTLGGLALDEMGHIPEVGEQFIYRGFLFTVLEMGEQRVVSMRVEPNPDLPIPEEEDEKEKE